MKKKYVLFAGVLVLCLAFSACNKDKKAKNESDNVDQTANVEVEGTNTDGNVVSMQKNENTIDKTKISKFLGVKTDTSGEVVITNETGREIAEFYLRPTQEASDVSDEDYEGDSWGADVIQGNFTLKDKEMALLYYDKENQDDSGQKIKKYDLQIAYKGMDASENCFFRDLDLTVTDNISLYLDNGIPYVKYTDTVTKKEVSTLSAAKERMGVSDGDTETEKDTSGETEEPTQTPGTDSADEPDLVTTPGAPQEPTSVKDQASQYIGKTLDQLTGDPMIGSPQGDDYDMDPGTGDEIGYHYYDGYTVYTIRNDDGSETIIQVE